MILYEFTDRRGRGILFPWKKLSVVQQAKLDRRLDDLRDADWDLAAGSLIHGTKTAKIFKVRVRGSQNLRPLLCYGPVRPREEVTFLAQAMEVGFKLKPKGILEKAEERRLELRADPSRRRELE